jgi:crotonobetaine/carnitine-CoA ligase
VPKFSASTFWRTVADTRATQVNTIAAVSTILTRRPESEFVLGHALRKLYGAPIPPDAYAIFQSRFGVPTLIEGYGMSEIPGALHNPFPGPHKIGSMGRPSRHPDPALPFAEVRVVDENGDACADGVTGELAVRTPMIMQGYFRDPAQTAAALRDGWFMTGDLARRDADGYFTFVARAKDIIRKRGENISGAELDRVLEQHPDVSEAAAIPVASELGEDEILVALVLRPGAREDAVAIAEFCRARLAAIKVPRYVAFVTELPRTATHRVEKYKLRGDAALRARAIDLSKR